MSSCKLPQKLQNKIPYKTQKKIPQKLQDQISSYLPSVLAFNAARGIKKESNTYDKVQAAIFKNDKQLQAAIKHSANLVLIRANLDILSRDEKSLQRLYVLLTAYNMSRDLQYKKDLFRLSVYKTCKNLQLTLIVDSILTIECLSKDFYYLFLQNRQQEPLQTKYCYYNNLKRKIRTLELKDILGISRQIIVA